MELLIIGTSHIAQESVVEISTTIHSWQPDIVAVELDKQRATALLQEQPNKVRIQDILKIGVKGYLFVKLGQFAQKKLGGMVGVAPGSEMKAALLLAQEKKLAVAFIDQPIQITLRRFSKTLTWKERFRFVSDIIKGVFQPKKQLRSLGVEQLDLRKVPKQELITKMMGQLQQRYPSIHKVLVEERNHFMTQRLIQLQKKFPEKRILAIVGAGHKEGMEALLKESGF